MMSRSHEELHPHPRITGTAGPSSPVRRSTTWWSCRINGDPAAEVRLRSLDGSVWLDQAEIAELFHTSNQNISLHIKNILEDGELRDATTVKESLTVHLDHRWEAPGRVRRTLSLPVEWLGARTGNIAQHNHREQTPARGPQRPNAAQIIYFKQDSTEQPFITTWSHMLARAIKHVRPGFRSLHARSSRRAQVFALCTRVQTLMTRFSVAAREFKVGCPGFRSLLARSNISARFFPRIVRPASVSKYARSTLACLPDPDRCHSSQPSDTA